jgi:lipopolysaccharide/colanic/teichoic acid biosynthesis glycosyltransferase
MKLLTPNDKLEILDRPNGANGHKHSEPSHERDMASESVFTRMLCLERKRAERSRRRFLLLLVEAETLLHNGHGDAIRRKLVQALLGSTRETDFTGWYRHNGVLGAILTEIDDVNLMGTINAILLKVNAALLASLNLPELNQVHLSFHLYPEESQTQAQGLEGADLKLYPDLTQLSLPRKISQLMKRTIDVVGSAAMLTFLSPLLAAIAVAIKLDSDGPVFFRQERLGQYGVPFTFLKFRSMYFRADSKIHEDYVKRFIGGKAEQNQAGEGGQCVYKLTRDPRISRVGRILRRTSLDELPQLFNVLKGQMSLVGPRPPVRYEFTSYDTWHRRRVLEAKPGITGLWQVCGRSLTKFDEMVRLDLRYMEKWSLALDIKILLQTPLAVLFGEGAY